MLRLSLASRLALMFAASTAVISLLAGLLFNQASEGHFRDLDEQLLSSKLGIYRQLLGADLQRNNLPMRLPALQEELQRHPEISLLISGSDGQVWFDNQSGLAEHAHQPLQLRELAAPLNASQADSPQLMLRLDIRHHQHFLQQVQQMIWLTMGLAALATALLGAWLARRGLRPLRQLTQLSQRISARSLDQRIDSHSLPLEMRPVLDAFNAMLARLEDSFSRLSGFSADIAHELRTPLSNLLTQTQVTLSQPRSNDTYRETLHDNLEELQQLTQLVNDMLFLAKAEHGLLVPEQSNLQLTTEVAAVLEFFAPLAEEQQVTLRQEGQGQLNGDQRMLRRALSNLIDNALRFTPPGASIAVSIRQQPGLVQLDVANQGPAIPAQQQARLFDRFYRADPARREGRQEHAGLGLAIVRSIIQAHGGTISCHCANGWTHFVCAFPQAPAF